LWFVVVNVENKKRLLICREQRKQPFYLPNFWFFKKLAQLSVYFPEGRLNPIFEE